MPNASWIDVHTREAVRQVVHGCGNDAYVACMSQTPAFLDPARPDVPNIVVPRGVTPFYLPDRPVRGRLVRLGPLADALLTRHDNLPVVTALSGQALALAAALATALKFHGSFSLQAKGDGPVHMLLADCTEDGALRGYARARPDELATLLAANPNPSAADLLGNGYLAFTVDQGADREQHQGIVAIEGETLADMALHYFATSEQMACSVRLACAPVHFAGETRWRAAALILERVSGEGGNDVMLDREEQDDAWTTATALARTVKDSELLDDDLPSDRLLYRLFGQEGVVADRPRALAYGCRCSRARLSSILEGFPADDLDHMATEGAPGSNGGGAIVMTCEFCNLDFQFGREEVHGLERGA